MPHHHHCGQNLPSATEKKNRWICQPFLAILLSSGTQCTKHEMSMPFLYMMLAGKGTWMKTHLINIKLRHVIKQIMIKRERWNNCTLWNLFLPLQEMSFSLNGIYTQAPDSLTWNNYHTLVPYLTLLICIESLLYPLDRNSIFLAL